MGRSWMAALVGTAALAVSSCTTPADTAATDQLVADAHHGRATVLSKAAGEDIYKQHRAACHDNPEADQSALARCAEARLGALHHQRADHGQDGGAGRPLSAVEVSNVSDYLSAGEEKTPRAGSSPTAAPPASARPKLDAQANCLRLRLQLFQQARAHLCAGRPQARRSRQSRSRLDDGLPAGRHDARTGRHRRRHDVPAAWPTTTVSSRSTSRATSPACNGSMTAAAPCARPPDMAKCPTARRSSWSATWAASSTRSMPRPAASSGRPTSRSSRTRW